MNLFFDTNILMDIVFERPFCLNEEIKILQLAFKEQVKIAVSSLSIVNTVYVAKKYGKTDNDVKTALDALTKHIKVLDMRGQDVIFMLSNGWKDYEDGLQYLCACNYKADFIITRNKNDFKLSSIEVVTPQEFLDMVSTD
ncbi:MAG: PIN domain-containing protein [Bacteroidales bacterium]|nr:PIN domain-containing protein [Bacteroidales bacterium]